ncbi:MAG: hypothetical protein QM564_04695 [Bergeyella sp.]
MKPENIHGIFTEIAVVDSLLVCGNLRSEKLLNIYSLKSKKLLKEIIQRGTAKNEGLSSASLYIQNNNIPFIYTYDITLGKLFKINLKNTEIEKEIHLTGDLKNLIFPSIINDSILLATTYASDDNRYFYANIQSLFKN